jgi:uncharacterized RmlC-like cupin family protein
MNTVLERDAVAVDPNQHKVELENERVRVVRIRYDGRGGSVMHQHAPGIGVYITDANLKVSYPDGRIEYIQAKAGEYFWSSEVLEHQPKNMRDKPIEVLYVEVKPSA